MIEIVFCFVLDAFLLIWFVCCIIYNIICLCAKLHSRLRKYEYYNNPCHNKKCPIRHVCDSYVHSFTYKEIEELILNSN